MKFGVLGPLQVEDARGPLIRGRKEQGLLAQLLAQANSAVPANRLAFGLWGDALPATWGRTLRSYIARLRRVVESDRRSGPRVVVTLADGWMLRVDSDDVDAGRFEALVRKGRRELAEGRAGDAVELFTRSLALWRGDAYAGFDDLPGCRAEAVRLAELRLLAEDQRLAALLAAGDASQAVADGQALLAAQPLRESRWALLVRAQYAAGRQAEALAALARARDVLRDELGVDPGPELQRLQVAVLAQDPVLGGGPRADRLSLPDELVRVGPRFVGRAAELDLLVTAWTAASSGTGGVLVVEGVAGIGASRLVAELARYAAEQGGAVRRVVADATQAAPCAAVRAALAGDGQWLSTPSDDAGLAEAARRVTASGRPALLIIEELENVDAASPAALVRLATDAADLPLLLVGVLRSDARGHGSEALRTVDLPRLRVGPLTDEAVAEIIGLYAGDGVDLDVAGLVAASGGSPRRAHLLASEAATRAVARRIRLAGARAERDRRGLAEVHEELAASVLAAERLRRQRAVYLPAAEPVRPGQAPYRGLAAFDVDDADLFFGRERVVADLAARLAAGGFLAVVGPSGCGKSSLVRAGLVPALLASGRAGASVEVRTPDNVSAPDDAAGVLVVDQLEEAFAAGSAAQVERVIAQIVTAARSGIAIVTIRSDFYADVAGHPELGRLLESGTALLGPMRIDELRRAIVEPAATVGLEVADDLVDTIVQDVAGEPGALPLLSVALHETCRYRDGNVLRLATYEAAGGLSGALSNLAEQAYDGLTQGQRRAARRVLTRLANEDNGRLVRRRAALAEICPPGEFDASGVIDALARRRLLVVADGTVEVGHEALFSAWPRCRDWLAEDASRRRVRMQVSTAAAAWQTGGRAETDLYRGVRLGAAVDWEAGAADDVTTLEREFLESSRAAAERERLAVQAQAEYRRRHANRLRWALIGVAALLVSSLVAGLLAVVSADRARTEATAAAAARLGALALTEPRVDTAALLAAQAVTLYPSAETQADLLATLLRRPEVRRSTVPTGGRLLGMGLSPDGRTIAVGDSVGNVALVDVTTWKRRGPIYQNPGRVYDAAFSPDGRLLLVTSESPGGSSPFVVTVWDVVTGVQLQRVESPAARVLRLAPATSPVVAVSADFAGIVAWRGDLGAWTQLAEPRDTAPSTAGFTPDGKRVLMAEQSGWATWYDPMTWQPISRIPISTHERSATLSPDGRVLAVGDDDGTVRLLDSADGRLRLSLTGQRGAIQTLRFDTPGRRLISTADDGTAVVWDAAGGTQEWSYSGLGGQVTVSAVFAASGPDPAGRLYLAAHDGTLLDVSLADNLLGRRVTVSSGVYVAAWPAGGDPMVGGLAYPIPGVNPQSMAAVPGSNRTIIGGSLGEVLLRSPDGPVRALRGPAAQPSESEYEEGGADSICALAASSDAERVFGGTYGQQVMALDGRSGETLWTKTLGTVTNPMRMTGLRIAYDAARNRLAVGVPADGVDLLDPATGAIQRTIHFDNASGAPAVAFDPRTGDLITGAGDGTLRFWDPATGIPRTGPIPGPPDYVLMLHVSPTGDRGVSMGHDGSVAVWDLSARRLLGRLPTRGAAAIAIAISTDGRQAFVAERDGTATVWNLDEADWYRAACSLAGRQLTQDEWHRFLPDLAFHPAC